MVKFQKYYVLVALCFFAGVKLTNVDEGDAVGPRGFDWSTAMFEIFIFGTLVVYAVAYRRKLLSHLARLGGPLPLVFLAISSALWSTSPQFSFDRGLVFLSATLFAYFLGVMYSPDELVGVYRRVLIFIVLLSVVCIVLLPSYGISHGTHGGAWRGASYHKNRFGELMALAAMTYIIAPTANMSGRRRWGLVGLVLLMLYESHSGTATGALAIVVFVQGLWPILRLRRKPLTGLVLAGYPLVFATAIGLVAGSSFLFGLLGKDSTFTGRDRLWAGILAAISVRPWLGYGYLTFWFQPLSGLVVVAEHLSWLAPQGHEGYLDLMLHLGIVGMVLFLQFFLGCLWVAWREVRRTNSPEARWFFAFLVFMAFYNVTESQIVEPFYILWITLTAFSVSFGIQHRRRRFEEVEHREVESGDLVAAVS